MAFPQRPASTAGTQTSDATSWPITVPAHNAGELLVLFMCTDGAPAGITPGAVNGVAWTAGVNTANGTACRLLTWHLRPTSNQATDLAVNVTLSVAEQGGWRCVRITGAHATSAPEFAAATGSGTAPNPPALNPAGWDVEDTLWYAVAGCDDGRSTISAAPANYTNLFSDSSGGPSGAALGTASREFAAVSDDPGTFTNSRSVAWVAATYAVRPVAASAPTVNAGADVTDHTVDTEFTRTATENNNGATITSRSWDVVVAPPGGTLGQIGTAAALSWTPTATGSYTLRYSATNSVGTGTDDMNISVAEPAAGDIPHTYVEGGHRLGPFVDGNGNLYIFAEVDEATGQPFMLKSTDRGDTWAEVDQAGRPTQTDAEGCDIRLVDHVLHIGSQGYGSDDVRYFTFNTSSHPTAPDQWVLNELVQSAPDPVEQTTSLEVRADGTVVVGYGRLVGQTTGHVCYKIRSSGGTWGSEVVINSADQTNTYHQITSVQDANGLIHFLYGCSDGTLRHRTLSTGDVLGGEQTVTSNIGASSAADRCPILPPRHHVSGSDQVVTVAYKEVTGDTLRLRTITNAGAPSAEVTVSDHAVAHNVLGMNSRMPVATLVRDDQTGEYHVFYANGGADPSAVDSTRTVYRKSTDGGVWQAAATFRNGGIDSHLMRAEVVAYPNGDRDVGLYWDTGSAGLEGSRYDAYALPAAAGDTTVAAVPADASAAAPAPTINTGGPTAPPSLRSLTSNSVLSGSYTVEKPAGTVDGDLLLIAFVHASTGVTWTAPDGSWTKLHETDAGTTSAHCLFYKLASSEPASWVFTSSDSANQCAWSATAIQDVDQDAPINASDPKTVTGTTTIPFAVTSTAADTLLFVTVGNDAASTTPRWSNAEMTEHLDETLTDTFLTQAVYTEPAPTAATYNRTISWSGANTNIWGVGLAVAGGVAPGGTPATVAAVPADANANAPVPAVVSADAVTITAVAADAAGDAPAPSVSGAVGTDIQAVSADASAAAPAPTVAAKQTVLLIVNNTTLPAGEVALRARLETNLGLSVTVAADNAGTPNPNLFSLVWIANSANEANFVSAWMPTVRDTTTPVITANASTWDDLRLYSAVTGIGVGGDWTWHAAAAADATFTAGIADPSNVTVQTSGVNSLAMIPGNIPAGGVIQFVVAVGGNGTVVSYEQGAPLTTDAAPARRVHAHQRTENYASGITAEGWLVSVDNPVTWALAASAGTSVWAVPADATADAPVPAVISADAVTIQAVAASAAASGPVPTVTAASGNAITAVAASATADAPTPSIVSADAVTIQAIASEATADAPTPSVQAASAAVVAATVASADAAAPIPVVTSAATTLVQPPVAEASADMPAGGEVHAAADIAATVGAAAADAPAPAVSGAATTIVQAVVGSATADAVVPAVVADYAVTIAPPAAHSVAVAPTPVVASAETTIVQAAAASAAADSPAPTVGTAAQIAAAAGAATADAPTATVLAAWTVEIEAAVMHAYAEAMPTAAFVHLGTFSTWVETTRPDRWTGTLRPDRWGDTTRPSSWSDTTRPGRWTATTRPSPWPGDTTRPDRWTGTIRPARFFETVFVREGVAVALTFVDIGPLTQGEIPEPLLVRVLETRRDGTTAGKPLHGQTPAWTATVHIDGPDGNPVVASRGIEILDPADLTTLYPDDFAAAEEGWVRVAWVDGDFDALSSSASGDYGVQIKLDNGTLRLKSTDVWRPEVFDAPAAAVGA